MLDTTVADLSRAELADVPLPELERHLDALAAPLDRLTAHRAVALSELAARRAAAAAPDAPTRAVQREERELGRKQRLDPRDLRQTAEAGATARKHAATGDAFKQGALDQRQTRIIGETLGRIPAERRAEVEAELLALARKHHGTAFAREARRIQAREAPRNAARRARFNHSRRSFRMWDNDEGGVDYAGSAYGLAAETLREAAKAFTRPDASGESRSPQQRAADGMEVVWQAALRSGEAPTNHGVRPQVVIVATVEQLAAADGFGWFGGSGESTGWPELGAVLGDARISVLLQNAARAPLAASKNRQAVPAGLWRALIVRDGGCTWLGCDAPPNWCDVAHGEAPARVGGVVCPQNATLLCRRHHRLFDSGWYDIHIDGADVTFVKRAVRRTVPSAWQAMVEPPASDGPGRVLGQPSVGAGRGGASVQPSAAAGAGGTLVEPSASDGPGRVLGQPPDLGASDAPPDAPPGAPPDPAGPDRHARPPWDHDPGGPPGGRGRPPAPDEAGAGRSAGASPAPGDQLGLGADPPPQLFDP
ncbi:MAG: DUF222 domain-containing protein [Nitriliruptoraceae bacterium]|nr:DUF222 domain-containing protein [Nitriliruptoraceae bacterium]